MLEVLDRPWWLKSSNFSTGTGRRSHEKIFDFGWYAKIS
jgi:hypothetical protein